MLQNNPYNVLSENISLDNIQKMGELITLKCLRGHYSYAQRSLEKLYIGLINDLNCSHHSTHIFSDAYDLVQNAICFLFDFIGKSLDDTFTMKNGKIITIKRAAYNLVSCQIGKMHKQMLRSCDLDSPMVENLSVEIEAFAEKDYTKMDDTIELLNLKARDRVVLDCYMAGMTCHEIAEFLDINRITVWRRRQRVQVKYRTLFP